MFSSDLWNQCARQHGQCRIHGSPTDHETPRRMCDTTSKASNWIAPEATSRAQRDVRANAVVEHPSPSFFRTSAMARFLLAASIFRTPQGIPCPSVTRGLLHYHGRSLSLPTRHPQEILVARYSATKSFVQQQQKHSSPFLTWNRHFSASSSPSRLLAPFQSSPIRACSYRGALFVGRPSPTRYDLIIQQQCRSYSRYPVPKRRPFRFTLKMMAISAILVAIPAYMIFDAPFASVILIPIMGGVMVMTGALLLLIVLPIVALGGTLTFLIYVMPATIASKEINKILKRERNQECVSGLGILGPDWEVQKAKPDEWFRWTFPKDEQSLDIISIRMGVFDSTDHYARKETAHQYLDSSSDSEIIVDSKTGESKRSRRFEFRNSSDVLSMDNLSIIREEGHLLIEMEQDGEKLLEEKWGKRYLELAKIVDRAASELEMTRGVDLGDQIVLVQKHKDSFWNKFPFIGNMALRIPFSRTWIHDVTGE